MYSKSCNRLKGYYSLKIKGTNNNETIRYRKTNW